MNDPQHEQEPIRKAIEAAQAEKVELAGKIRELEKLQQRLSQLDSFIKQGQLLLGVEPSEQLEHLIPSSEIPQTRAEKILSEFESIEEMPNWKKALVIMRETRKPIRLSELASEFEKRDWKLSPKNAKEILRTALNNKPDFFVYDRENWVYSLKRQKILLPALSDHPSA